MATVLRSPILHATQRALVGPASPSPVPSTRQTSAVVPMAAVMPAPPPAAPATVEALEAARAEGMRQGLAEAEARIAREIESRWRTQKTQWEQTERRRADEHTQRLASLDALLQAIEKSRGERFIALEQQTIELAYEALCRVCGPHAQQESRTDRAGLLADLLRQGVRQLRGQAWLGVRMNPQDHELLLGLDSGQAIAERHPQVQFTADATLDPLCILIETDHGQLDVGLQTQLSRLRDLWLSVVGVADESAEAS